MPSSRTTQPDHVPSTLPPKTGRRDGHDPRGRFTPGNRCGKGNPAAQQTAALRQALRAAITPEDITEIAEVLRELAMDGNLAAIRLLLSYVIGRPGAGEEDPAEPGPPLPDTPPGAQEPAPVGGTAAQASEDRPAVSPGGDTPTAHAAGAGPAAPAPEAPPPPPATVDNGCAAQRRRSSVGASPTRQLSLQPVAIGAASKVTNSPKPPV